MPKVAPKGTKHQPAPPHRCLPPPTHTSCRPPTRRRHRCVTCAAPGPQQAPSPLGEATTGLPQHRCSGSSHKRTTLALWALPAPVPDSWHLKPPYKSAGGLPLPSPPSSRAGRHGPSSTLRRTDQLQRRPLVRGTLPAAAREFCRLYWFVIGLLHVLQLPSVASSLYGYQY